MKPYANRLLVATFATMAAGSLPTLAAPVQYDMDLHTYSGMGAGGAMGVLGSVFGKQSAITKYMNLRLNNPGDIPEGYSAEHTVPTAMGIGPKLPLKGERRSGGTGSSESSSSDPDGRILIYWGCSDTVQKGQPQIIDLKTLNKSMSPEVLALVRQAQARKGGGGAAGPGESLPPRTVGWPAGDTGFKGIPSDASAIGEHTVKASFMNEDIRYNIGSELDFLEPLNLKAGSDIKAAVPLNWDGLARAKGYNLHAVGAADKEVVIWMAMRNKSPMLPASQTSCTIPAGIFEKVQVAMVAEEGVGPTGGFAYPPQEPGKPKKPLIWTARVRVSTNDTAMIGLQQAAGEAAGDAAAESVVPGGGSVLKGLKGLFGK